MSMVTANSPLHASYEYRSVPVAASLGRRGQYALFEPLHGLLDWPDQQTIEPVKRLGIADTVRSTDPLRETPTQIPITLLPDLASVPHPAVSSPEAS